MTSFLSDAKKEGETGGDHLLPGEHDLEAAHIKSADSHGFNHLATSICRVTGGMQSQMASPMLFSM